VSVAVFAAQNPLDYLFAGEVFTLVAYGQLLLEYRNMNPDEISDD
jgi:hypothetical protein